MGDDNGDASSGDDEGEQGAHSPAGLTVHNGAARGSRGFFTRIFGALGTAHPGAGPLAVTPSAAGGGAAGTARLRQMTVADVMVPKAEIVSVPADITREELAEVFRDSGVSRVPVYRGTLDSPAGLIHLKDFALKYGFGARAGRFSLSQLMRPLLYVPPSMPLSALLQKMQAERIHMALVIDEYGGVDGLVTIEDIIEQVVGEIEDEHDTEEAGGVVEEAPGVWLVPATEPLAGFEGEIGRKLADAEEEDEVDTVGGLVVMLAGRVPARGEVVAHPDGHEFVVTDADPRRVKRLRLRLKAPRMAAS